MTARARIADPDTGSTAQQIVLAARNWIGTPYHHQASRRHIGCDCLGLVRGVWRDVYGIEPEPPPAYSASWAEDSGRETLLEAAGRYLEHVPEKKFISGDLLLFRWRCGVPAKHAAIAATSASMIHAQDGAVVCEVPICSWWRRHLAAVFRFPSKEDH